LVWWVDNVLIEAGGRYLKFYDIYIVSVFLLQHTLCHIQMYHYCCCLTRHLHVQPSFNYHPFLRARASI